MMEPEQLAHPSDPSGPSLRRTCPTQGATCRSSQRCGEVRTLGHGVASPGRLEDRVRKPGTVAELLDQARLSPRRRPVTITACGAAQLFAPT